MTALLTRLEIEKKLEPVFEPAQTTSLVEVLDSIRQVELERAADTRDLKHGLRELTGEVKKLAVAQRRTESSVAELSRTVQTLAEGMVELRQAVGSLANTFGFSLEEFVAALLPPYLERHAGVTGLTLERRYFEMADGRQAEVDMVGTGQRDEQPVTVLAECRTTVGGGEMRRLADKLTDVAAILSDGDVLKVVVAMNLHPTGEEAARETGVWAIPYSWINRERG